MPNRLALEQSLYLQQHRNNPVDWYPWGAEAFGRAVAEDKPVFLSVGYSSCHWCHVMERECFEDEDVAELLNAHFISIKVDREELPDVDEAYMTAVQLQSGRGGWPMSVFLCPDKRPFFAATYIPKHDRGQMPGMMTILREIRRLWEHHRDDVRKTAALFAEHISRSNRLEAPASEHRLEWSLLESAVQAARSEFDAVNGGFGGAPKFPAHATLEFLLAVAESAEAEEAMRQEARHMATTTLERMALGGVHDQIGGGFHRYSVDAHWLQPHFEKMLYDNALLLRNYRHASRLLEATEPERAAYFRQVSAGILGWLKREMSLDDGLYAAALDADTDGIEGATYVWTMQEVLELLGEQGEAFAFNYGFHGEGNYREEATGELTGMNIPHLRSRMDELPRKLLDRLLDERMKRPQPQRDDKALVGWNGLAMIALVEAGEFGLAGHLADAVIHASAGGRDVPRVIHEGHARGRGYLEDYASVALGMVRLAKATRIARYQEASHVLLRALMQNFHDSVQGGFFGSSSKHEMLFGASKPIFDQPITSGNALATLALLAAGSEYNREVERTLRSMVGWMDRAPLACCGLLTATLRHLQYQRLSEFAAVHPVQASVDVSLEPSTVLVEHDGWAQSAVVVHVPVGWHLKGAESFYGDHAFRIEVSGVEAAVDYPKASPRGLRGVVRVPIRLRMRSAGDEARAVVSVRFQACTDRACEPVETRELDLIVQARSALR